MLIDADSILARASEETAVPFVLEMSPLEFTLLCDILSGDIFVYGTNKAEVLESIDTLRASLFE